MNLSWLYLNPILNTTLDILRPRKQVAGWRRSVMLPSQWKKYAADKVTAPSRKRSRMVSWMTLVRGRMRKEDNHSQTSGHTLFSIIRDTTLSILGGMHHQSGRARAHEAAHKGTSSFLSQYFPSEPQRPQWKVTSYHGLRLSHMY